MKQLEGRTVFITGSGGVLGSTYVRRMLEQGAKVVATDLPGHRFDGLNEAHGDNPDFAIYPLDVGSEEQIVEIGAVIALFGFNNRWNALMETDVEDSVTSFVNSKNYKGPEAFKGRN